LLYGDLKINPPVNQHYQQLFRTSYRDTELSCNATVDKIVNPVVDKAAREKERRI
jgi:hypothetical protein